MNMPLLAGGNAGIAVGAAWGVGRPANYAFTNALCSMHRER